MNNTLQPNDALRLVAGDTPVPIFLEADLGRIRSPENRRFALGLHAQILSARGLDESRRLQLLSAIPTGDLLRMAAEVEPKNYEAGQMLAGVSEVLRALARIVNSMRLGHHEEASAIARRISWSSFRQSSLAGIFAGCLHSGETELAQRILAEIRETVPTMASSDQFDARPDHDDNKLRMAVQQALAEIIPPGTRFPFSRGLVEVRIESVDAVRGEAELHIGACRFVEGCQFAPFLERELKARIPLLQRVGVGMSEL